MGKQRNRKVRPVCKEHWQMMRKEAMAVIPVWSRPLAGLKIKRILQEKGIVRSDEECTFCGSGSHDKNDES